MIEQSFEGKGDYYRRYEGLRRHFFQLGEINHAKAIRSRGQHRRSRRYQATTALITIQRQPRILRWQAHRYSSTTVAATDAPCTGLSVIYNDDRFLTSIFYPQNPGTSYGRYQIIAKHTSSISRHGRHWAPTQGRASIRTESPLGTGITRVGMAIAKECYLTLRDYGS